MKIRSIRVRNFQAFKDSGITIFESGINLLVGQNNSGKSSLIRALRPMILDDRHRTSENWNLIAVPGPHVDFEFEVSGSEVAEVILLNGIGYIPVPSMNQQESFIKSILQKDCILFNVYLKPGNTFQSSYYPSHRLFPHSANQPMYAGLVDANNGAISISSGGKRNDDSLPYILYRSWSASLFFFDAERLSIGESDFSHSMRLEPNAVNLPAVILSLQGERPDLFDRLNQHIRDIFSTVHSVSASGKSGTSRIEIRVWPTADRTRGELAFPLSSSGTGVSQVVCLLAAIMTIDKGVFVIDEINSFLHPGAVKSLLRIIKTFYSHHQYIISTHAPEVISFGSPSTIHMVSRSGYNSHVRSISLDHIDAIKEISIDLGFSMADVFAADRIIWVEGPTEELCFPFLYYAVTGTSLPQSFKFSSVSATGDFSRRSKDRRVVFDIYRKMTTSISPLVNFVGFSFDSEGLSQKDKCELIRASGNTLRFLPRRQLENYCLVPSAIANFVNERDKYSGKSVGFEEIERLLIEIASEPEILVADWDRSISNAEWVMKVDASKLISKVVSKATDQRITFRKKGDTLFLLRDILEFRKDLLVELLEYVKCLCDEFG
jgi:energy-coupling factor transporter ATP-binding protein EcfA2